MGTLLKIFKLFNSFFFQYPKSLINNLTSENFRKLIHALQNESFEDIKQNIQAYFERNKNVSPERIDKKINQFISTLDIPDAKIPLLFVSHETTRTGAPLIVLKLANQIAEKSSYYPVFICLKSGDIADLFKESHPSYIFSNIHIDSLFRLEASKLLAALSSSIGVKKAIVNSVESARIIKSISKHKIEITSLIHEMANYYPKGSWSEMVKKSKNVIYPARYVENLAGEYYASLNSNIHVLGQGLLKPNLLEANKKQFRKQIRKELGCADNALIILGCGSTIARKGIDIFTHTAISVLNQNKDVDLYFIWIGDAPKNQHQLWTSRDIDQARLNDRIKFIGALEEPEPYFLGSDLFFMTSRGDPFPCVVHEAMGAGLGIVAFDNAGGFSELIDSKNGIIVPYGDIFAAATEINNLIQNSHNLEALSLNARAFAKSNLDFNIYTENILKILG